MHVGLSEGGRCLSAALAPFLVCRPLYHRGVHSNCPGLSTLRTGKRGAGASAPLTSLYSCSATRRLQAPHGGHHQVGLCDLRCSCNSSSPSLASGQQVGLHMILTRAQMGSFALTLRLSGIVLLPTRRGAVARLFVALRRRLVLTTTASATCFAASTTGSTPTLGAALGPTPA